MSAPRFTIHDIDIHGVHVGTYVQLDCLDCEQTLSFGKPIAIDSRLSLRLFSEIDQTWHEGDACWIAVQAYLFRHMGHRLVFREDSTLEAKAFGDSVGIDDILR